MVQGGEKLGLTLEPRTALRVTGELVGRDFDRNFAAELGIPSAVHLPHAPGADGVEDFILAEACTGGECHGASL